MGISQSLPGAEKGTIFISHAIGDRALADALREMAVKGFSGSVRVFQSSARGAGNGLDPGGLWFQDLDRELTNALQLWVLATRDSIVRPWILYESGHAAGKGIPVIPILVNVTESDLPEPLRQRQSYRGHDSDEIQDLIEKVGGLVGLTVAKELTSVLADSWVKAATEYSGPEAAPVEDEGTLSIEPEQVSRIEALITRLESVADARLHASAMDRLWRREDQASEREGSQGLSRLSAVYAELQRRELELRMAEERSRLNEAAKSVPAGYFGQTGRTAGDG